jgi:hypothetical protein
MGGDGVRVGDGDSDGRIKKNGGVTRAMPCPWCTSLLVCTSLFAFIYSHLALSLTV